MIHSTRARERADASAYRLPFHSINTRAQRQSRGTTHVRGSTLLPLAAPPPPCVHTHVNTYKHTRTYTQAHAHTHTRHMHTCRKISTSPACTRLHLLLLPALELHTLWLFDLFLRAPARFNAAAAPLKTWPVTRTLVPCATEESSRRRRV